MLIGAVLGGIIVGGLARHYWWPWGGPVYVERPVVIERPVVVEYRPAAKS